MLSLKFIFSQCEKYLETNEKSTCYSLEIQTQTKSKNGKYIIFCFTISSRRERDGRWREKEGKYGTPLFRYGLSNCIFKLEWGEIKTGI